MNELLGKRFKAIGPKTNTFVTVVKVNQTTGMIGLWWEVPADKMKYSEHTTYAEFKALNLARA